MAFGSLFSNITMVRTDEQGVESQRFVVPIEYVPRESWLTRLRSDADITSKVSNVWPKLAFEMTSMRYDPSRKLNSLNQSGYFARTPYLLSMSVYAIMRSVEDLNQLMEQITPYFTPDRTLPVNVFPSVGVKDRMRIVFDGTPSWTDSFEQDNFTRTREIMLTMNFTVAVNFFGPIPTTPPNIIRKVIIDLYDTPLDATLAAPVDLLTNDGSPLRLSDDSGRLLDESSISDLREYARVARIESVPDPVDAQPVPPVYAQTTVTTYADGKVANAVTGDDVEIDITT